MRSMKADDDRARFDALPMGSESGEAVAMRDGWPIDRLGPADDERADAVAAMEEIHRLRRELRPTLGGITIREHIEDGRDRRVEWLMMRSRLDEDDRGE